MIGCVVVGGGISGLALGHELLARGVEPLVLESEPRAGGKIESRFEAGALIESGPAGFLDRAPVLARLCASLGLRTIEAEPAARRRAVAIEGQLIEVPRGPLAFAQTPLLSLAGKLRLLAELGTPRRPVGEFESVAAFAERRFGREASERIFFPLISGLYAGDPERINLRAAFPALAGALAAHRTLLGAAAALARGSGSARLRSFPDGMEELPRALAARLGPRLRRSSPVRAIVRDRRGFRVQVEERGRLTTVRARTVALALPAWAASPLVATLAPEAVEALESIPYVPVALVYLTYRQEQLARPLDLYGFLSGRGGSGGLLGAVFSSSVFAGRAPAGELLVSARLGGARHPELLAQSDAELAALAHAELASLIGLGGSPRAIRVVRHARALPQYTTLHRERLARLDAVERACPGLFFTGNAYRGLGVPDCVANAATLAAAIAGRQLRPLEEGAAEAAAACPARAKRPCSTRSSPTPATTSRSS